MFNRTLWVARSLYPVRKPCWKRSANCSQKETKNASPYPFGSNRANISSSHSPTEAEVHLSTAMVSVRCRHN